VKAQPAVSATVAVRSEGERADIRAGDVVVAWARGGSTGTVASPFDLFWVEMEQASRGPVTLEGRRGSERRFWTLGEPTWGLDVQPTRPDALWSQLQGRGLGPAAALRQAQIEMWKHKDWSSPYFWGAFALPGEP